MSSPGNGLPDGYDLTAYAAEGNTGEGSQADPFIPTTCNGFMWAVLQQTKYVKLTTLIDFSRDDNYKNGITTYLNISCTRLYADTTLADGNLPGINGLTVSAAHFIWLHTNNNQTIDNVSFLNCIWSRANEALCVWWRCEAGNCTATGCVFSLLIKQNGHYPMFEYSGSLGIQFISCSQYFTFSGDIRAWTTNDNSQVAALGYTRQNCTIQLSNYVYRPVSSSIASGVTFIGNNTIKNSTIYGDVYLVISSTNDNVRVNKVDHICLALNLTYETNWGYPVLVWNNQSNSIIVDKDIIDANISCPTAAGVNYLTTAQMKSDTYLTQIGFLP